MSIALIGRCWSYNLSQTEKLVLIAMAWFGDDDGSNIFPTVDQIAGMVGLTRRGTQKVIRRLQKFGIIELVQEATNGMPRLYRMSLLPAHILTPEAIDQTPAEMAMASWNAFADEVGLPAIRNLTEKRRAAINKRADQILPELDTIYEKIRNSSFLMGKKGSWRATFDWLWLRPDAHVRTLEGAYDDPNDPRRVVNQKYRDRFAPATKREQRELGL